MKKLLSLTLMVTLVFSLSACGEGEQELVRGETPVTDGLTLETDYDGKDYVKREGDLVVLADGIGEATLAACNDGDTADFIANGIHITSRFVGIDTPESGHIIEEWGIEAGDYACDIMENADTIVLEAEPTESAKGSFGRFLSYIWVDGRLLNVEMVEQGYSPLSGVATYSYADAFYQAFNNAQTLGLRIHGENDPTIPDDEAVDVSIETLVENSDDYMYRKVNLEGVVTARLGNTSDGNGVFIGAHDSDYGIYFNLGHDNPNVLNVGNNVIIENARFAEDTKDFEAIHITDYRVSDVSNPSEWQGSFTPQTTPLSELTDHHNGRLFEYDALTITAIDVANDVFTVADDSGDTMPVHQHTHISESNRFDLETLTVGATIDLLAPLSVHDGQLTFFFTHAGAITVQD